ncbi:MULTISPECIES: hypothetical protein [Metabacillus]|uniref:Uncharacterized protein n=2 Tax=Metabacillus TaxID=2675233 RepID=A0A179T301_9BACI|nr:MULTISPECIES: hypothetical protein [Metabacillus]OAS87788.1 hypothetical protein A6K24_18800 [Metabacillus litoralis]QNF27287.1 hypothetical protein HUW50_07030 [Metabacillus sp. KUDC1714]
MTKNYHLDLGYVTVPEANKIVLRILRITNQNDKSHYNKLLTGAKEGLYGGKKYGKRMYQVRREDIIQYAETCLQNEQLQLFDIELVTNLNKVEEANQLPKIENGTAKTIHYYLRYLKFHEIISEEVFLKGEKNLIMRVKMKDITLK